jgi:glycosyltransferase involved in cell wall biosynthesis
MLIACLLASGCAGTPEREGVYDPLEPMNRRVHAFNDRFDRAVARRLQPVSDGLFLGFAGSCLRSLSRANELGYTTAVERASSHIRTQRDILREEYDRYDAGLHPISDAHVKQEEREYDEADYIVTPSQFAYESFLDHGFDESRVFCVPFGTDIPETTISRDRDDDQFRFLFVGTVDLRKGVQYLLDAWERLELPNAELVIVGRATEAAQRIVADNHSDSVRFVGWSENPREWYRRASVFVFPTLEEGSARVVYEAMTHGLPIVTTFNSGWVGEDGVHGIEVPIRDPTALADAMRTLFESQDRRQEMGERGQSLIRGGYTWEDYGDRIHSTYQSMIEGH